MSNLSITTRCNKSCPYCFAGDFRNEKAVAGDMNRDTFLEALLYLRRSGIDQVRLLGGEPTLHKDFIWMARQALARNFRLMVFSNGLMGQKIIDFLGTVPDDRICILLNTIHALENNLSGTDHQKKTMKALGRKLMPGINIYTRGQRLDYLIDYINQYELRREIRIGIAHPVLSAENRYLMPKFYPSVGKQIVELFFKAQKEGISLQLDCGFVPCMFPEELSERIKPLLEKTGIGCNPNIDLLPDGKLIACYPLNNMPQYSLDKDSDAGTLIKLFRGDRVAYDEMGIFSYCPACHLFKAGCSGGCLSHKINRIKKKRGSRWV